MIIPEGLTKKEIKQYRDMQYLNSRINLIKILISNMCDFKEEWQKEYILDSVSGEISLAFSIGRYSKLEAEDDY